ncbi:MAG: Sjogren's syndrome/scleroderma autoantigen 1 family protein [Nitrososphaeraceae archaeon]|jgi:uncharacterized Zn finger protein (UPF0148 family)
MPDESKKDSNESATIKKGAELVIKGGSIISEPCSKCGGVQVRFKDKIICVNCGNEQKEHTVFSNPSKSEPINFDKSESTQIGLEAAEYIIQDKFLILIRETVAEKDIAIQKQKIELIEMYLRILEKTRQLMDRSNSYYRDK